MPDERVTDLASTDPHYRSDIDAGNQPAMTIRMEALPAAIQSNCEWMVLVFPIIYQLFTSDSAQHNSGAR